MMTYLTNGTEELCVYVCIYICKYIFVFECYVCMVVSYICIIFFVFSGWGGVGWGDHFLFAESIVEYDQSSTTTVATLVLELHNYGWLRSHEDLLARS